MKTSRSYTSSGQCNSIFRCSFRSCTSKVKPSCSASAMTSPAVLKGSANILKKGRLNAPAEVLSPMNTITGSEGRSSSSISAAPGPAPRMLPEKASVRRSCPAP